VRSASTIRRYHDAITQLRQIDEAPAIERQLHHLPILDDVADLRIGRLEQWSDPFDDNGLGHGLDTEGELESQRAATFEDERLLLSREAGHGGRDLPSSDPERWKEITTFGIGHPLHDGAAVRMRSRDGDTGQDCAGCVAHDPANLTGVELGEGKRRMQYAGDEEWNHAH